MSTNIFSSTTNLLLRRNDSRRMKRLSKRFSRGFKNSSSCTNPKFQITPQVEDLQEELEEAGAPPCPRCSHILSYEPTPHSHQVWCDFCSCEVTNHLMRCSDCSIVLCVAPSTNSSTPISTALDKRKDPIHKHETLDYAEFYCYDKYYFTDEWRTQLYGLGKPIKDWCVGAQKCWAWCVVYDMVNNPSACLNELNSRMVERCTQSDESLVFECIGNYTAELIVTGMLWHENDVQKEVMEWAMQQLALYPGVSQCALGLVTKFSSSLRFLNFLLTCDNLDPSANDNLAIASACKFGHVEVVNRLLQDKRVDPSANNNLAVANACKFGYLEIVKRLLQDDRVDLSQDIFQPMILAAESGHYGIVDYFLQNGRVDATHLLQFSCFFGHFSMVEWLLKHQGVDPSECDNGALLNACRNGHRNIVDLLLNDGRADPTVFQNRTLWYASKHCQVQVVERLLQDKRVDPSVGDSYVLRTACDANCEPIVYALLEDGRVDPKARDYCAFLVSNSIIRSRLYPLVIPDICFHYRSSALNTALIPYHRDSLLYGGCCLSQVSQLPEEVVQIVLKHWATLGSLSK